MEIKITNGTIKDLTFEADFEKGETVASFVKKAVKAFVGYMTDNALVSDNVLISSIGARFFKEALVGGAKDKIMEKEWVDTLERVVMTESSWAHNILMERYGTQEGTVKSLVLDGIPEDEARTFVSKLAI